MKYVVLIAFLFSLSFSQAQLAWGPVCIDDTPPPQDEIERQERIRWQGFRDRATDYMAKLPLTPDPYILMPVQGARVRGIADTWGAPRPGGRFHEGQDVFARRGTPLLSATAGYVVGIDETRNGGKIVLVIGAGARLYYYAHLDSIQPGLKVGDYLTTDSVIGTVGNTGNAITTPPHLHFGIYYGHRRTCDRMVIDPLPLLRDR